MMSSLHARANLAAFGLLAEREKVGGEGGKSVRERESV